MAKKQSKRVDQQTKLITRVGTTKTGKIGKITERVNKSVFYTPESVHNTSSHARGKAGIKSSMKAKKK